MDSSAISCGFHMDSIWIPVQFHVDSMEYFHSTWIPYRIQGEGKVLVNTVSPYSMNPSREIVFPMLLEENFHHIPVNLGASLKTLAVMQDEARVCR